MHEVVQFRSEQVRPGHRNTQHVIRLDRQAGDELTATERTVLADFAEAILVDDLAAVQSHVVLSFRVEHAEQIRRRM